MSFLTHLGLFAVVASVVVVIGVFYAEPEDGPAFRSLPRRLVLFLVGCAVLAGIMLVLEHTVAAPG